MPIYDDDIPVDQPNLRVSIRFADGRSMTSVVHVSDDLLESSMASNASVTRLSRMIGDMFAAGIRAKIAEGEKSEG